MNFGGIVRSESQILVGIDIGNTKVITCVGKVENGTIDIIGVGKSSNQGVRKGVIVDLEETVSAITASLEEAERMSGANIEHAVVGITGPFIECEQTHGIVAVSQPTGEISLDDAHRVLDAARAVPSKPNREVLHILPLYYVIDSNEVVKDPVGMTGIRLEVTANIITASSNAVKSVVRAFDQAGIHIEELIFSPLALSKVMLSKRQMDIGVMTVEIGASTTSYTVWGEGELANCGVIPIGSMHITNDIAIGLRTNLDIAETIKQKFGYALSDRVPEKEEIDLSKLDRNEEGSANLKYIAEIIEARLNEVFMLIKDNLTRANIDTALPAGIVVTGGGAKIDGIVEMIKDTMCLPAQIGKPAIEISGLIDKLDDPIYSTAIGLMLWGKDRPVSGSSFNLDIPGINDIVSKVRSAFKSFMP